MKEGKKNLLAVLLINAVITALFLSGQYCGNGLGTKNIILITGAVVFLMAVLPLLVYKTRFLGSLTERVRRSIRNALSAMAAHPLACIGILASYLFCGALAFGIAVAAGLIRETVLNMPLFYMLWALFSMAISVYLLRNSIAQKPENLCFVLILTAGLYFIAASPVELGVTWDDEAHYERTLSMANLPSSVLYEADDQLYQKQPHVALEHYGYARQERLEEDLSRNESYSKLLTISYEYKGLGNYSTLSYIPFAFGLTMGRGLHLPYTWIFRLGRLVNLLTYAFIIWYAMKRLKYGKIICGAVAMIPTMLFMASLYSYDPCVVGCMILGFSVFFSYLQDPDAKMSNADIALICFSFLIGCLPKAVYCVVLLPLLFLPANRFRSRRQHALYLLCGFVTVGILAGTVLLPRLMQGNMGTGDIRGGSDVNATEQFAYIMEDPKRFLGILGYFLSTTYLNPVNAVQLFENYAYLGINGKNYLTAAVLLLTALSDRDGKKAKTVITWLGGMIGAAGGVAVVAFTFYLSYTPVGYYTVLGCQSRYLLPIVFPFLYMIGIDHFRNPVRRDIYNAIPLLVMACSFVLYTGMWLMRMY